MAKFNDWGPIQGKTVRGGFAPHNAPQDAEALAEFTPDIAPQVIEACTQNAEEIAGALGRTLDGEFVVKPGEAGTYDPEAPPEGFTGGGLAVLLKFGEQGLLALLPAATGFVPDWVQAPDATGDSKLSTLAQELSMLLVPEELMADDSRAAWVEDLPAAVAQAAPVEGAGLARLEIAQGETLGLVHLLWPVAAPDACLGTPVEEEAAPQEEGSETTEEPTSEAATEADAGPTQKTEAPQSRVLRWLGSSPRDYRDLPSNTRSLLQVEVSVAVLLAKKKHHIRDILDFGPGSILTFDKQCDGPIELEIGDHTIAEGDPVKVGEKFGFRVSEMVLPREHFSPMTSVRSNPEQ